MHEMANPVHCSDAERREEDALLPSGADHMVTLASVAKEAAARPSESSTQPTTPSRPAVRRRSLAHGDLRLLRPTVTALPPARLLPSSRTRSAPLNPKIEQSSRLLRATVA